MSQETDKLKTPFELVLEAGLYSVHPLGEKLRPRVYFDDIMHAAEIDRTLVPPKTYDDLTEEQKEVSHQYPEVTVFRRRGLVGQWGIEYRLLTEHGEPELHASQVVDELIRSEKYEEQLWFYLVTDEGINFAKLDYGREFFDKTEPFFNFIRQKNGVIDAAHHREKDPDDQLPEPFETIISRFCAGIDAKNLSIVELYIQVVHFLTTKYT